MCLPTVGFMIIIEHIQWGKGYMAQQKTALVTGGAGFIASHLVDRLLALEYRVVVVDNLSTGHLKNLNQTATFHHVDITDPALADVFQREQPDLVFHLAAQTSVSASTKDPIKDSEINVLGTLRLLEASRRSGIEKFIYSSTGGALYGNPEFTPCTEDHPIAPVSPYGMSKYQGELQLELFRRIHLLRFTILRYGNVFGPRQDPHGEAGVIAIFSQAMLEGRQPQVFGDGEQTRDFVYVDDVVQANICAISQGDGAAFNIGTGQASSINSVYTLLQEITGYRWPPEHGPARTGDVVQIYLDNTKAAQGLGWAPQATLEEGLLRTAEYFKQVIKVSH